MFRKLFNPAVTSKTGQHMHPTLQEAKAIDYAQMIKREFLLVVRICRTELTL